MTVTLIAHQPTHVSIDGHAVAIEDIEYAAHQDDPIWCHRHGRDLPTQDEDTLALASTYRAILAEIHALQATQSADWRRSAMGEPYIVYAVPIQEHERIRACRGHEMRRTGRERCFEGPVYSAPYTDENRAAHGWMTMTEYCAHCPAERDVNVNGRHREIGVWG